MRRPLLALLVAAVLTGPVAAARAAAEEPSGPVVDVVEVAGVIDRPIANYILDRIESAEKDEVALLVLEINSLGGLKVLGRGSSEFEVRLRDSTVPIGVWVGPRSAVAGGLATVLMQEADFAAITPSGHVRTNGPADLKDSGIVPRQRIGGRAPLPEVIGANEAVRAGIADFVAPSLPGFFQQIDGRVAETAAGPVTISLPEKQTTVRFFQPGPIRRFLHAFANPALVYITLVAGALMLAFELFQPGFGVAGWTSGLFLVAVGYGFTVLPIRWPGLVLFCAGVVLLTFDVLRDEIFVPTALGIAGFTGGSMLLLPGGSDAVRISPWLIGFASASALIFFAPIMTFVRRARRTIPAAVRQQLVGLRGQVRSMLNPEGFVWIQDELWRARSEDGSRVRSGEAVEVASVDGAVLVVRAPGGNGSSA